MPVSYVLKVHNGQVCSIRGRGRQTTRTNVLHPQLLTCARHTVHKLDGTFVLTLVIKPASYIMSDMIEENLKQKHINPESTDPPLANQTSQISLRLHLCIIWFNQTGTQNLLNSSIKHGQKERTWIKEKTYIEREGESPTGK